MRYFLLLFFIVFITAASGQQKATSVSGKHSNLPVYSRLYETYKWDSAMVPTKVAEVYKKEPSYTVFEKHIKEYVYDGEGILQCYLILHRRIRINTSDAIEKHNKVMVSVDDGEELVKLEARTLSASGKVTVIDPSNIKDAEENDEKYKILAIEGLEPGGELEYVMVEKLEGANYYGSIYLQSGEPEAHVEAKIFCPQNLKFEAKVYNGTMQSVTDSMIDDVRMMYFSKDNVPAINEEKFCFYYINKLRVEYKLTYNSARGNQKILMFSDAAKSYFETINSSTDEDFKAVEKLTSKLKLKKTGEKDAVMAFESWIKSNIAIMPSFTADGETAAGILKKNLASKLGAIKLYMAYFHNMGYNYNIVLTTDRRNLVFDKKFESYHFLNKVLLYLPDIDLYLSPDDAECRLGMVPFQYTDNDGLFIEPYKLGDKVTALSEVKHISCSMDADSNTSDMTGTVTLGDFEKPVMHLKQQMRGYEALNLRPTYFYLPNDKREEVFNSILKSTSGGEPDIKSVRFSNFDINTPEIEKPFTIESDIKLDELVSNAGDKYIFKVGMLIGEQAELYQEKERTCPVQLEFPHSYHRTIIVNIPDGYTVSGLENLKMSKVHNGTAGKDMYFTSDYTLNGSQLRIYIEEAYKKTYYPLEQFPAFREVINESANFNKAVIVFNKKG